MTIFRVYNKLVEVIIHQSVVVILSLLIIPIIYSFMPLPKKKHLNHLERTWIENVVNWMEKAVKEQRITIYIASVVIIIFGSFFKTFPGMRCKS